MNVQIATNQTDWDTFLSEQQFRPFLQSWTMGEVYRDCNQPPVRLEVRDDAGEIVAVCQALLVPARRGRHLSVPYGPVVKCSSAPVLQCLELMVAELTNVAREKKCSFIRMSPFWPDGKQAEFSNASFTTHHSPLHLLAEHIWYLPLVEPDPWQSPISNLQSLIPTNASSISKETLFSNLRKTTRNLIRRAEKEGVTITRSESPVDDLEAFIELHEETRKRHQFTPYTNRFFRSQVEHFSQRGECTLYQAHYNGEIIASSVHMHLAGETSYHHGASTHKYDKIPASYLLQWTAICDAIDRGDHVYSFWGIAPVTFDEKGKPRIQDRKHPFAGVTTFKTGYGGSLLELMHCIDIPVSKKYYLTRGFEVLRKWRRGF